MKISIIIPVYNAEKTIERLLESINIQTYKNYEIIVVNDGSADKTEEILLKYKNDKMKLISKKNEGVGEARKIGFENAIGDLIFFCDSDDYLPNKNVLDKINNKFSENNIDILMFDAIDIKNNEKKVVNCFSNEFSSGMHKIEEIDKSFLFGPLFLKIFKKEKLNSNCFIKYNNFEDTYTTYKYLNGCSNFYYEKDIYYVYDETSNENSLTKKIYIDKFIDTVDLIEIIYNESNLKESCCISTFNYYLYLVCLIEKHLEWNKQKVLELKTKMEKLEKIFLNNFELIQNVFPTDCIKKYINYKYDNNNKKIILIDGISTTGKSTISDKLNNYFIKNNLKVKWLHEESFNDINLNLDLPKHKIIGIDILKMEMKKLLERWESFYDNIKNDDITYILDSNFFKNIHDYMLFSDLELVEIKEYYNRLINIFEKDKMEFVFLKRNHIKESFENTFKNRGSFWETHYKTHMNEISKNIIKNGEECIFYKYEQIYQNFIEKLFDQFEIDKLKISTDDENWDEYINIILNKLNLKQTLNEEYRFDYQNYVGSYSCEDWQVEIYYDEIEDKMFLSAFWPKIELIYRGNNTFKLDKFPLQLQLINDKIIFTGDLIWNMKNKEFKKVNNRILKK